MSASSNRAGSIPRTSNSCPTPDPPGGTPGPPRGVVSHHRGAFLQALAMAFHARLGLDSVYLWTLPMFHTNGWCFPWAVTLAGARHRCLRRIDPTEIWGGVRTEGITHLRAAPPLL